LLSRGCPGRFCRSCSAGAGRGLTIGGVQRRAGQGGHLWRDMDGVGECADAVGYFSLLRQLREFRAARLRGEPSDRALGRAAGVKADTVKAWLVQGQFPQDAGKLAAVVRAVAAEARAMVIT
jgi:hypothetical protein